MLAYSIKGFDGNFEDSTIDDIIKYVELKYNCSWHMKSSSFTKGFFVTTKGDYYGNWSFFDGKYRKVITLVEDLK